MADCIFCKIIAGELPSTKIYEDDTCLAFLDIAPVNAGHTLVVPKRHTANIEETDDHELQALISAVKKIGAAFKSGLGVEGYNVTENNDPVAGQIIPHLHFHIIPRTENDGLKLWPQHRYEAGQENEIAEKIKTAL